MTLQQRLIDAARNGTDGEIDIVDADAIPWNVSSVCFVMRREIVKVPIHCYLDVAAARSDVLRLSADVEVRP